MKKRNYIIWGLSVILLLQVIITGIAAAAGTIPDDLTDHPEYLVVHNTTDAYADSGGPTVVSVKDPDNNVITPAGNVYDNIPEGSKLYLTYRFNLNDGVDPDINTYEGTNYFIIDLPEDINYDFTSGGPYNIVADPGTSPWVMGTWTFTDSHTILVDFADDVKTHLAMWGEIGLSGTFESIEYGDETERILELGSQSIIFRRPEPEVPHFALEKSGAYDAASNTIEWTVTVTPPSSSFVVDGYQLVDAYSANQEFVSGSFVRGVASVADTSLDLATANQVTYTFPDTDPDTTGVQVIKYKTRPLSFSTEDGTSAEQSTFTNAATVKKGIETAIGPVTATVTTNWISKAGSLVSTSDGSIITRWTVDVTVPNGGSVSGGKINDTIPKGMELIKDDPTHPIQITPFGGTATTILEHASDWGTYSYSYTDIDTPSYFEYRFPSSGLVENSARVIYYTKLTSRDHDLPTNSAVSFSNNAKFSWDLALTSFDWPGDKANVQVVGNGGLISKTAGGTTNYNHQNGGYIHWTITVNRNKITMTDASVGDVIPEGQELVIDNAGHPFTVNNGTADTVYTGIPSSDPLAVTDSRHFTYTFPTSFTSTYTLDYFTRIIDVSAANNDTSGLDLLYRNGNVSFGNGATLYWGGSNEDPSNPTKTYSSQMIAKGVAENYNYNTHTVKWSVVVNRNRLPMTNAKVTDTLPAGMEMLVDATHPFTVTGVVSGTITNPSGISSGATSFTYDFGAAETTDQYTLTFYTLLKDDQLITQWSSAKTFTNAAQLTATEINTHIDASAAVSIDNPVISKDRTYIAGSDSIDWTISINAGLITLDNAYVTDQLDPGLQLETASLKLYEVNVDPSNGTVGPSSSGMLVTSGYTVDYPSTGNLNTLTVHLPEGSTHAYRLEFTTFIIADDLNFTNQAVLSGSVDSPDGDDDAQIVTIDSLWSSGGSGSQTLTVYKDDGHGHPVPGSIYQLFNFNKEPILKSGNPVTATTDSNGKAIFTDLPAWVFYAKEIYAPDGFLLNPEIFGGERLSTDKTFNTADASALGTVSFNKTNHKGAALSGGVFTLTGKAYDNTNVTMSASSVNGTVTFTNVPLGTYTIRETSAPAGYYVSDTVLTATVEYADASRLAVKSTVSAAAIIDKPILSEHFGSIKLKKTGQTGKTLAGAEFGLYNSDGALVMSAVSKKDGIVAFSHVQFGNYVIRETKAPKGYALGFTDIAVTVDEDDVTFEAGTVINKRDTGSPGTGDDIMGYFVLALASLMGIAVVYVINKRIKKVS